MYHCIVNPVAGRGEGVKFIPKIESFMQERGMAIKIEITKGGFDAAEWAKEACNAGSSGIIGVGGDGTIQEIVTGMLASSDRCSTPLMIISCGSGNDWCRTFYKAGQPVSMERSLDALTSGSAVPIDAIRVSGDGISKATTCQLACINITNMGLDTRIVRNAQPLKKIFGHRAYVVSAIISALRHKNTALSIQIDGDKREKADFTLVAMCNGEYYGGGMRITPSAVMNDGRITLCTVKGMPGLRALMLFPVMLMGRHTGVKAINFTDCERVTISTECPQTLCLDGNLFECNGEIDFRILPKAILIAN